MRPAGAGTDVTEIDATAASQAAVHGEHLASTVHRVDQVVSSRLLCRGARGPVPAMGFRAKLRKPIAEAVDDAGFVGIGFVVECTAQDGISESWVQERLLTLSEPTETPASSTMQTPPGT